MSTRRPYPRAPPTAVVRREPRWGPKAIEADGSSKRPNAAGSTSIRPAGESSRRTLDTAICRETRTIRDAKQTRDKKKARAPPRASGTCPKVSSIYSYG
ncbi:hypothetical protein OJF2_05920 [Aquisphaera giovannonii]|uniref:Uncharacterized protein n=1 Tax=Aquisphaera giovannonii TaxID=406548 RepID=A0A5B9VUQ7_9BACT|nr:hypothetical protein OJF2_05920 [Aquisphaera giovannonii]